MLDGHATINICRIFFIGERLGRSFEHQMLIEPERTMSRLKVKKESLPQRCEICHQADLFLPQTGDCLRCNSAELPIKHRVRLSANAHNRVNLIDNAINCLAIFWYPICQSLLIYLFLFRADFMVNVIAKLWSNLLLPIIEIAIIIFVGCLLFHLIRRALEFSIEKVTKFTQHY
jgi:hypothetical protein